MPSNGKRRSRSQASEDHSEDDDKSEEWVPPTSSRNRGSPVPNQVEPPLCPHFDLTADLKRALWSACVSASLDGDVKGSVKIVQGLECRTYKRELYCLQCKDFVYCAEADAVRTHAAFELVRRGLGHEDGVPIPSGLGLRGLVNLGNTCFMNAVLQVLLSLESFRQYFLGGRHRIQCVTAARAVAIGDQADERGTAKRYRTSWMRPYAPSVQEIASTFSIPSPNSGDVACCFGCEMEILLGESICPARMDPAPFTAQKLLQHLWASSPALAGYYQQDAQELYNAFANALHAHVCSMTSLDGDSQAAAKEDPHYEPSSPSGANQRDGALACQCVAHKTLGGVLQSQLSCTKCGFVSPRFEPYFEVPLDVLEGEDSLENRLEALVKAESISGVFCSKCEAPQEALKRLSLHVFPQTLVIHLKRFQAYRGPSKNNAHVVIPAKGLDLKRFSSSTSTTRCSHGDNACECFVFDLRAVVEHAGQLAGGHYICYVRDEPSGFWFKYDDAIVARVDEAEVLDAEAYMLFFQKRHT